MKNTGSSMVIFERAAVMLAEADTIQKARELKSMALTAGEWAKRKGMGEAAIAHCRSYALEAERKMGGMLAATDRARGGQPHQKKPTGSTTLPVEPTLAEIGVSKRESAEAQKLAAMPVARFEALKAGEKSRKEALNPTHVGHNSGKNEWYTPAEFIESARRAMGSIDCDPASSKVANKTVGAGVFFDAKQDGLKQEWNGNIWMNPPYAQPLISKFATAVVEKFNGGEIKQACVLVNNATETGWFQGMLASASAVCFVKGRVKFLDPQGNPGAPLQGQAVIYLGKKAVHFSTAFQTFGPVLFHEPI